MTSKDPPGPPMDLAKMREQGVRNLIAYREHDSCRRQDSSTYRAILAKRPTPARIMLADGEVELATPRII